MAAILTQLAPYINNDEYLKWWLVGVAGLRLFSVALGYFWPFQLKDKVFAAPKVQFTDLNGRTFAVWTAVTCAVTLMTAFNLSNAPLVQLCVGSFVIANTFFMLEKFVYGTVKVASIAGPFFFASECLWVEEWGGNGVGACTAPMPKTSAHLHTSLLSLFLAATSIAWLVLRNPKLFGLKL